MHSVSQSEIYRYQNPNIRRMGYLVWFVFGVISIIFFKERVAFMDGAFQLFNLINTEEFSIHHYRLTNPLTQIFAWLGVKFGLPLKYVMIGYSFNFIIFHAFIFHLIVKWCKNDFLGLVQVGFFTLFVTQSFYFLPPEYYQGMSILLLWTAILLQPSFHNSWWRLPLLSTLLILIIFDHALLSIFFLFIWTFLWLHEKQLRNPQFYILLGFMILVYILHDIYFTSWYDEARKGHFWRHWNQYYPHFENIPGHKVFLRRCLDTYYLFPILLLTTVISYIRAYLIKHKKVKSPILKLILVLGFCFFYLLINHINDPKTQHLFYMQVNYIGLTIPLLIPLCFDFLPQMDSKKYIIYVIGIIILIRVITIIQTSDVLKERHKWMLSAIEDSGSKKAYVTGNDTPKDLLIQTWSVPEETLLLTSINGAENSSSLLIKLSNYKYNLSLDSTHVFLRSHSAQPIEELNAGYFNLGDSIYYKSEK